MDKKKKYETPDMEITKFENEDVITVSDPTRDIDEAGIY